MDPTSLSLSSGDLGHFALMTGPEQKSGLWRPWILWFSSCSTQHHNTLYSSCVLWRTSEQNHIFLTWLSELKITPQPTGAPSYVHLGWLTTGHGISQCFLPARSNRRSYFTKSPEIGIFPCPTCLLGIERGNTLQRTWGCSSTDPSVILIAHLACLGLGSLIWKNKNISAS